MIPWWWALIAWVIGEIMAIIEVIICVGGNSKKEEREQLVQAGLLYPENKQSLVLVPADKYDEFIAAREKKAADAGTSTAARETGGKD